MKKNGDIDLSLNEKKVLYMLVNDAKTSDYQIAKKIGISQPAIFKLRKKLESKGFIKSYSANIDYSKIGIKFICITLACKKKEWSSQETIKFIKILKDLGHCAEFINNESDVVIKCFFRTQEEKDAYFKLNKNVFNNFLKNIELRCLDCAEVYNFESEKLFRKIINHSHPSNSVIKQLAVFLLRK